MSVNVALLEQVMTRIEDHPEQHDQTVWVNECGTAACFAGWACLLSGWQSAISWDESRPIVMSPDTLVEKLVPDVAIELLGIGNGDAVTLFDAQNTRQMLRLMVKDLLNGEDLRDWEDYNAEAAA
jgi:hypothetical protein